MIKDMKDGLKGSDGSHCCNWTMSPSSSDTHKHRSKKVLNYKHFIWIHMTLNFWWWWGWMAFHFIWIKSKRKWATSKNIQMLSHVLLTSKPLIMRKYWNHYCLVCLQYNMEEYQNQVMYAMWMQYAKVWQVAVFNLLPDCQTDWNKRNTLMRNFELSAHIGHKLHSNVTIAWNILQLTNTFCFNDSHQLHCMDTLESWRNVDQRAKMT